MAEKKFREKKWGTLRGCDQDNTALQTLQESHARKTTQKVRELSQRQRELSATQASLSESRKSVRAYEDKVASSGLEKDQLRDELFGYDSFCRNWAQNCMSQPR